MLTATASYIKSRLHLPLLAIAVVLFGEFLARGSVIDTLVWCVAQWQPFLLNVLLAFGLLILLLAVTGRTAYAFPLASLIALVPALLSGSKLKSQSAPLYPWDVWFRNVHWHPLRELRHYMTLHAVIFIVLFAAVSALLIWKAPHFRIRIGWIEKLAFAAVGGLLLWTIYDGKPIALTDKLHIDTIPYEQAMSYANNGFWLSTVLNLDALDVKRPAGYGQDAIAAITGRTQPGTTTPPAVKPNVIVILSEAFWDPTQIKGVTFSRDPVPFFHSLQQTHIGGRMLSPQYGGGTANVEFEVLTGNTNRFVVPGYSLPYVKYVNRGVDSLASILARQGYTSTAINPFYNWFFNSRNVYGSFGFGKFVSSEFFPPVKEGLLEIEDSEVASKIIETSGRSEGPDFIFANTMENHHPFYPGKIPGEPIRVSGAMSEQSRGMLESLALGISHSDLMLETVVRHFEQTKEPTIVVFFGDHLPALGNDYDVYKDTGYISGNDDPDFLNKMYSVPVAIWNNYLPERREQLAISPSFLGAYVLRLAGLPGSPYTDFLYELSRKHPIIPPANRYAELNIDAKELDDYKLLEYDILFGKQYMYREQGIAGTIIDRSYRLGFDDMAIAGATAGDAGRDETKVTVAGSGFVPNAVVYMNGLRMQTSFVNESTLVFTVPKSKLGGKMKLQTKLVDAKHAVVGQSNLFVWTAK